VNTTAALFSDAELATTYDTPPIVGVLVFGIGTW
jgi:hypothetical protein